MQAIHLVVAAVPTLAQGRAPQAPSPPPPRAAHPPRRAPAPGQTRAEPQGPAPQGPKTLAGPTGPAHLEGLSVLKSPAGRQHLGSEAAPPGDTTE